MTRRVVLDTSVLFPSSLRDLLLTLAALGALEVAWSDEILSELIRTVSAHYPDIEADRFEATTVAAMTAAFPQARVQGWEDLVEEMDNEDADRHVAAAAVAGNAEAIVTLNTRDFGEARSVRMASSCSPRASSSPNCSTTFPTGSSTPSSKWQPARHAHQ